MLETGVAFMHRPIVTQVSRWDKLKGFVGLMRAWVDLKTRPDHYVELLVTPGLSEAETGLPPSCDRTPRDKDRHRRMLRNACLVLAGPDPRAIADDPEGIRVLEELKQLFDSLPMTVQRDIKIIELPMESEVENATIVCAIQKASNVIVQCSLQEGFGLTATEAMLKRVCTVVSGACGLRTQVRHLQDGYVIQGSAGDYLNVARALNAVLGCDELRSALAINGQKRAMDRFLMHTQMEQWLRYSLAVMGIARPMIRRTQSAPDVLSLLAGGLVAGDGRARGGSGGGDGGGGGGGGGGGSRRRSSSAAGAADDALARDGLPASLSISKAARASQAADGAPPLVLGTPAAK